MELRKTTEIAAPAHAVFSALTDSKELTRWWPDIGTFEPRLGGKFHFTFLAEHHKEMGDMDRRLDGEVLEIVPTINSSTPSYPTKNTGQTGCARSLRW